MFKQSFQINEFRTNAISNASVYKAYQAKVHPKPESRLSPILPVFLGRSWCLYLCIYVRVCVSLVKSRPAAAFKLFMQTTTSTASFRKFRQNSYASCILTLCRYAAQKKRVSVWNCVFSWQRWQLRIRLENFKQISLGKSLKHQPCSGPRLNFLLDFFCLKFSISTLPTTTFIKRSQGRRCTCTATIGTRVIHWSFKTITELEILWTFATELSSPAVASRLKVLQKSCFGHTTSSLMTILSFFNRGWVGDLSLHSSQQIKPSQKKFYPLSWMCGAQPGFAPAGRPSDARWPPPGKVTQNISNAAMLKTVAP